MTPEDRARYPALPVTLKGGETVTMRPLAVTDGEALADFYADVPREHLRFYGPHPLDRPHALKNAARADSPTEVVQVLEAADGRIAGYAWYRWTAGNSTSILGICIRPSYQERGASRTLMGRLAEIAREVGPPVMALTVQLANIRAVALYTSMGFSVVREQMLRRGEGAEYPDEPEYCMERRVRG